MVETFDEDCGGSLLTSLADCVVGLAVDEEIFVKVSLVCFDAVIALEAHFFICRVQLDSW